MFNCFQKIKYRKQKKKTNMHFGKDDIIVKGFHFNPVHEISTFQSCDNFDFYLDTGNSIFLCYFSVYADKEIEKYTDKHSQITSFVIKKEPNANMEKELEKAVSLVRTQP